MSTCSICMQVRRRLKFKTGRISICSYCVRTLNTTQLSPRLAEQTARETLRNHTISLHGDAPWVEEWVNRTIENELDNPARVQHSPGLKVIRAHRRGLVCLDRKYLKYPAPRTWNFTRYWLRHQHGYACYLCNAQEADGATLDAHHIVFRSKSGRNDRRNLVTICRDCHQKQHRGFVIGADGGEPEGRDDASLEDGHDDDSPALETMPPVGRTEPQSPRAVPEIATHPEKVRMDSRASSVAIVDDIGGFGTPRTDVQRPPYPQLQTGSQAIPKPPVAPSPIEIAELPSAKSPSKLSGAVREKPRRYDIAKIVAWLCFGIGGLLGGTALFLSIFR